MYMCMRLGSWGADLLEHELLRERRLDARLLQQADPLGRLGEVVRRQDVLLGLPLLVRRDE